LKHKKFLLAPDNALTLPVVGSPSKTFFAGA